MEGENPGLEQAKEAVKDAYEKKFETDGPNVGRVKDIHDAKTLAKAEDVIRSVDLQNPRIQQRAENITNEAVVGHMREDALDLIRQNSKDKYPDAKKTHYEMGLNPLLHKMSEKELSNIVDRQRIEEKRRERRSN